MKVNRFKNTFSENIFKFKYAQGPDDTWDALAERLVDDVCGTRGGKEHPILSKDEREQLTQYIKEMKFIPGGRYLWYAGRKNSYFNNCFIRSTNFITDLGIKSFNDFNDGDLVNILSPITLEFLPATIKSFGKQHLNKITFQNVRGKSTRTWEVIATPNHRWLLTNGLITDNLTVGNIVPASGLCSAKSTDGYLDGLRHGMVFADGNEHKLKDSYSHQLRLCGKKSKYVKYFEEYTITYPQFSNGEPVVYIKSEKSLKSLPDTTQNIEYLQGFLDGWIALDGHDGQIRQIHSTNKEAIEFFINWCWILGLVVTGNLRSDDSPTNFGDRKSTLWFVNFTRCAQFQGFKVVSIEPYSIEEVWCVIEPEYNLFTLEHGIVTGNCFLLRAEEDTREEWADLTKRATSCLMTGGGIGADYSIIRPSGRPLTRTGGLSSGPIPLMQMINEVGRGVMQGGSRRSAIYASLNWQHEDIPAFLTAKNWSPEIKALKSKDFNFPAPLDMTNISVNYDDAWLNLDYKISGVIQTESNIISRANNPIFLENCKQAMMTGEPGFSFNFGSKQNETLRNACTEVTSEDDSDVCNLGSINLSNINNLEEFKSVVSLGSKFLVCGTLRADLPYDRVYRVREKNRRLGLGLMGIHAWLLQRKYGYEVVPELHEWLQVYKDESERAANEHCERLYISRPIAYRAIAPTGSIGILAGTTTGIEPLFAVAYKRRYLTEGTKWKYEYVVDTTADQLIKEYGLDPSKIDTAYGLAHDYEKRIRFQADIQDYVDMSISSTINLPPWGTKGNSESDVFRFAKTLSKYTPRLRGFTCYPDGSRGGQPLTEVSYEEAIKHSGIIYEENIDRACSSGVCGV